MKSYHLKPGELPQPMADQGRYLLAQQAYMEDDKVGATEHLRALAGHWQPQDWHTRGRIGVLAAWTLANGQQPGPAALRLAGGAPYVWPRYRIGWVLLVLGCMIGTTGVVLAYLAQRLKDRWGDALHSGALIG